MKHKTFIEKWNKEVLEVVKSADRCCILTDELMQQVISDINSEDLFVTYEPYYIAVPKIIRKGV